MQPSLAVLDPAGTTVAATDEVAGALHHVLEAAGFAPAADAVAAVRGRHERDAIREMVRRAAPGAPVPDALVDDLHAAFRRRLLACNADTPAGPIPGAEATLRWLAARVVRVVLTTGFDRALADAVLAPLGWGPALVAAVVCADHVPRGRPTPDMIHHAMQLAGVADPAAVLVVGDTVADLQAGRAAGAAHVIAVLSGAGDRTALAAERPTAILGSVAELPAWWASRWPAGRGDLTR